MNNNEKNKSKQYTMKEHYMNGMVKKFVILIILIMTSSLIFAQSDSRYDAGLNLPFNEKAGDVNPQTGNITLSATDVNLPGRAGMNFSFGRIWALNQSNAFTMSVDPVDGGNRLSSDTIESRNHLGIGWNTSIPYLYRDDSSGEELINLFMGGSVYEVDRTGVKTDNPGASNLLGYDLLTMRIYEDSSISYADFTQYALSDLRTEFNIGDTVAGRNAYILVMKTNEKYYFRNDGALLMQEDRTGLNRIWYFYNTEGRLRLVVDTIGRKIRFTYTDQGNLAGVAWDVTRGIKAANGTRSEVTETRQVTYTYTNAESFTHVAALQSQVIDYKTPYLLSTMSDPMGNTIRYEYEDGLAGFTYNSDLSHSENVYLLLTTITAMYTPDGAFKNKRCFEYEIPESGMHTKWFYTGYMEYYKISREYYRNRHDRIMNDTRFIYHDENEAGNFNQYTAVVERGNVRTTYTYSLSDEKNKNHVLDTLLVKTGDGFTQLTDYVYNDERTKELTEVFRQGAFAYREQYHYDGKGNLKWQRDRMGLITTTEYDEKFSLPIKQIIILNNGGIQENQETQSIINELGQVIETILYVEDAEGVKRGISQARVTYDQYGNPTSQTDALGETVYTVYDETHHTFPVKIYRDVSIAAWDNDNDIHHNWQTAPDGTKKVRIRSWKVFNSDGTVRIEVDNEGYAIEHFYDEAGTEIEVINPDLDDLTAFAQPIEVIDGSPVGNDFDNFLACPDYPAFLASRINNPGARMEINYQTEYVKTISDVNKDKGLITMSGEQSDGLRHVEEEIVYTAAGEVHAVKRMTYDDLGKMLSLTDPDADPDSLHSIMVDGRMVDRYDKTWIIKYDDLGRTILVLYPTTIKGKTHIKQVTYNDLTNTTTTIDPEGKTLIEERDWNGNVIKTVLQGNQYTDTADYQTYYFTYDQLNRKTEFIDAQGLSTRYVYDERNLMLKQIYGSDASADVMTYDDKGQLVTKTDRKGNQLVFTYDEIGRNTAVSHYYPDTEGAPVFSHSVDMAYDNRGNAVRISNQTLIEHYIYDYANRVIRLERRLLDADVRDMIADKVWSGTGDDQVFSFDYVYNDGGMVTKMTYPDGAVHTFAYDEQLTRLSAIKENEAGQSPVPFVNGFTYTPSGVVTRMNYANKTFQTWDFDNRKRISRITIGRDTDRTTLTDLTYSLDGSGNIKTINDNQYQYDGFNRIIGAKTLLPGNTDQMALVKKHFGGYLTAAPAEPTTAIIYNPAADLNHDDWIAGDDLIIASLQDENAIYDKERFEYDKNGNRTKLIQNGALYFYTYGSRNRLEKIEVIREDSQKRELFAAYKYDANGNTVQRTIYKQSGETETIDFTYDTLNRLIKTSEGNEVIEYLYDNAGNRFIKKSGAGLSLYLRHGQIAVAMDLTVNQNDTTDDQGSINRYVLSGDLIAGRVTTTFTRDPSTDEVTGDTERFYYHLDHLNSTKAVTREDGTVEVMYEYRAFGEQLKRLDEAGKETGDGAKYSYGGKELDEATNLYYFNARYYDATIGRFINVDPIQDGTNWYVYCSNNPLCFVDPTGLRNIRVEDGDTLSEMAQGLLNEKGIELNPSEMYSYVDKIAERNELDNPDLIYPGQNIDFPPPDGYNPTISILDVPSTSFESSNYTDTTQLDSQSALFILGAPLMALDQVANDNPYIRTTSGISQIVGAAASSGVLAGLLGYDGLVRTVSGISEIVSGNKPAVTNAGSVMDLFISGFTGDRNNFCEVGVDVLTTGTSLSDGDVLGTAYNLYDISH